MYRVSGYNIYLPLKKSDDYLLVQGAKGSFDIVNQELVDAIKNFDPENYENDPVIMENLDALIKRGYITSLTKEEEFTFISHLSRAINKKGRQTMSITLLPTYNCNFRCEYCFERNLQKNGAEWLGKQMTPVMVDAIFEALKKCKEQGSTIDSIYLFGGEPLLKTNKSIVEYICQKATEMKLPISCISNGYTLDEYIDIVNEHNWKYIQITVDGIGEEHDKRRFLAGGQPTYDTIIKNVDLALKKGVRIVMRSNVNKKNIPGIKKLIDLYTSMGWIDLPNFKYYFKSTMQCYDEVADSYSDVELMKELSKIYGDDVTKFQFNSIYQGLANRIGNMLKQNTFAPLRSGYCGANMGMYTIDPFGDIYPCWDVLSDVNEIIGTVDLDSQSFVFNDNHERWKGRTVDKLEECKECPYMLFCGGGCAAQAKIFHNDINRVFCDNFQNLFNEAACDVSEAFLAEQPVTVNK